MLFCPVLFCFLQNCKLSNYPYGPHDTSIYLVHRGEFNFCCHHHHFSCSCRSLPLHVSSSSHQSITVLYIYLHVLRFVSSFDAHAYTILYPESSGFLVSGCAPGETPGESEKINFFYWLLHNSLHCFTSEMLR